MHIYVTQKVLLKLTVTLQLLTMYLKVLPHYLTNNGKIKIHMK